jgi:hypothetical protein
VFVDHDTLLGVWSCLSQVPADVALDNKTTVVYPPEGTDTTNVAEALFTVIAPLDWLLLNEKIVPFGSVVAFGNWIT